MQPFFLPDATPLRVYVYTDMLALFASKPYHSPSMSRAAQDQGGHADDILDLTSHLTNTCLQSDSEAKDSVFLLSDLVGKSLLQTPASSQAATFSDEQLQKVISRIGEVVGETFRAGLGMPNHFSVHTTLRFREPVHSADNSVSRPPTMHSKFSASTFFLVHPIQRAISRCPC